LGRGYTYSNTSQCKLQSSHYITHDINFNIDLETVTEMFQSHNLNGEGRLQMNSQAYDFR
jgi:hypothetical protein